MQRVSYDVLARRRLGRRLREMRDAAKMPPVEAAHRANLTEAVLERLERGDFAATPPLTRSLMRLYGQDDAAVVAGILDLVTQAWQPGWWSDFPHQAEGYLAWEASAANKYEVATSRLPELLQTKAYAGTVLLGLTAHYDPCEAEQTIQTNLDELTLRQYRLVYRPVMRLHAVVTEAAVRAVVGGELVMLAQWLYLERAARSQAVTLRVLLADAPVQTRSGNGWQLLEFADAQEPARLFRKTGSVRGCQPVSGHAVVRRAREQFERLCAVSLSPDDSAMFLKGLIDETIAAHPVAVRS
jgi:hypothetical protein